MNKCPNKFPLIESLTRLAVVGEAPGHDEILEGEPFVGQSGRFLSALLSRAGTPREACFIGNVCQTRPPGNEIASFDWGGPEIQEGLRVLHNDLTVYQPNCILALGGSAIHALRCHHVVPRKVKVKGRLMFKWPFPPSTWRGSLFLASEYFHNTKSLGTLHPAFVLSKSYEDAPLLQFDIKKAAREATSKKLTLPVRDIQTDLQPEDIIARLKQIRLARRPVAIDIEGGIDSMSCISFATGPKDAFIIPFFTKALKPAFDFDSSKYVWRALAGVLEDPLVPKILQNSLYDLFVLAYSYGIRVRNVQDDTMLKAWELYCELPKNLGVQTSIYTDEPYYKGDRDSQDDKEFFTYCCKDSSVTYEINNVLSHHLTGTRLDHYRLNLNLLNPLLWMELRGIRYDTLGAASRRATVRHEMFEEQARLNGLSGNFLKGPLWDKVLDHKLKKAFVERGDYEALARNCYKDKREDMVALSRLVSQPNPTLATIGEIEDLIEVSLNTGSNLQMASFLYDVLGLPVQYKKKARGQTEEPGRTADYEALLKLCKLCTRKEDEQSLRILQHAIKVRSLETRQRMLGISADRDGRIRCGYNIVGSETGRITCYTSPTGSGYNLQTIPKYDRDLFLADEGYWMFQCDLSGADGWTVAAYSAMLGDRTMLDDYLYGLKPAKILVLALQGYNVDFNDREALKKACKEVDSDDWNYFAMKRVQHGCSYVEGPITVSDSILTDSEGALFLEPSRCKDLRDNFFFRRYRGVKTWHEWMDRKIRERPLLMNASGSVRNFFGRKEELLPKALAQEPQHNTTYATKLALYKLWTDRENRTYRKAPDTGKTHEAFRIEPLHTVHDSLVGQFRKEDTEWAVGKIKSYFANPINIAGQQVTIPFEGSYGKSWGDLKEGVI